jgi:hypothetical protein
MTVTADHRPNDHAPDITDLPELSGPWRWLWHSGYYDGPLTGMVLYGGKDLWAEVAEECHHVDEAPEDDEDNDVISRCSFYRRYRATRLTDEAYAEQMRRHELFRQMVGRHCDYDETGRRAARFESPPGWHDFYDLAKTWERWGPEGEHIGVLTK